MPDEDRVAAPLHGDDLADFDLGNVDLGRGERQRRGVRAHRRDQRPRHRADPDGADRARRDEKHVPTGHARPSVPARGSQLRSTTRHSRFRRSPLERSSAPGHCRGLDRTVPARGRVEPPRRRHNATLRHRRSRHRALRTTPVQGRRDRPSIADLSHPCSRLSSLCALPRTVSAARRSPVVTAAPLRLALFQPDIPQNAGTLLRTCACLGLGADLVEPAGFPTSDRHFRRAGLDYLDAAVAAPPHVVLGLRGLAGRRDAAAAARPADHGRTRRTTATSRSAPATS